MSVPLIVALLSFPIAAPFVIVWDVRRRHPFRGMQWPTAPDGSATPRQQWARSAPQGPPAGMGRECRFCHTVNPPWKTRCASCGAPAS